MQQTRRTLERVPDDKLDWKAHPKSNTIGWLADHLANIPGWAIPTLTQSELDLGTTPQPERSKSIEEILAKFDRNVAAAREALAATTDAAFAQPWSLLANGQVIFTQPRAGVYRGFVMSHLIHHRAILTVYLRLNDLPVPSLYGPSGDEQPSFG